MPENTMVICASGPSLCKSDVNYVLDLNIPIMTVNSSWMMVPKCQFIFAADNAWWRQNNLKIRSTAQRWTCSETAAKIFGLHYFNNGFAGTFNSGMVAISLAMSLEAKRIILLGYDCSLQKGVHWHGKHKGIHNPTPYSVNRWKTEFEKFSSEVKNDTKIINCSRESSLKCFPLMPIKNILVDC